MNNKWLSYKLEEIVLKDADAVLCPNNFTYRYVVNLGVVPTKILIVPHWLPDHLFSFKFKKSKIFQENGIDESRPIVLFVGRLERDKQVDVLIDAIPLILKRNPELQFVFIGDGSLLDVLKGHTQELGVERNVWFLGYQDTGTIKYCLAKSSVVWIPMSGFVVYEAAAAAKPIVAFDVEWHQEFVKDGQTGLLVENRNYHKLAEAIKRLVTDPALAELLGKNARSLLEADYDPQRIAEREIAELLEVIHRVN